MNVFEKNKIMGFFYTFQLSDRCQWVQGGGGRGGSLIFIHIQLVVIIQFRLYIYK